MKYIISTLFVAILVSCNARYMGDENEIELTQINGYLSKRKPRKTTEGYVLNENNFSDYLEKIIPAWGEEPVIDFKKKKVAIIILPESSYDTRIILNKGFVEDSVLHIKYSVHQVLEKRSYRLVPTRVFTFNADVAADSILFEYGETRIKKPIK